MNLHKIWGLKALDKPYHQACIDWAEQLLIAGNTSDNVLILASLGMDKSLEPYEVEGYFNRVLQDIGQIEPNYFDAIKLYGLELCRESLEGELALEETANLLAEIYSSTNYDYGIFSIWTDLSDELYLLENEDHHYTHPELTQVNKLAYIKKQIRHFVVLLNSDVPPDFIHLHICNECRSLVKATWRKKTRITKYQKIMQLLKLQKTIYSTECLTCGSANVTSLQTVEARERALKMLQR